MVAPTFIEEKPVSIAAVSDIMAKIEKRDEELNYRTNKTKEFLENFTERIADKKADELHKKLSELNLTRLKDEHIAKIIDFLPKNAQDLKVILQAYPLSMPKKDQDAIVDAVKSVMA